VDRSCFISWFLGASLGTDVAVVLGERRPGHPRLDLLGTLLLADLPGLEPGIGLLQLGLVGLRLLGPGTQRVLAVAGQASVREVPVVLERQKFIAGNKDVFPDAPQL
jgi:hypothetical protein